MRTIRIPGAAYVPQLPGLVFYACAMWPDCALDEEEFIPAHQYDPNDAPYCPIHRTTPMSQVVRRDTAEH